MIASLLILVLSAIFCLLLGALVRTARLARVAAVVGTLIALAVSLVLQGLSGSGERVEWPLMLSELSSSEVSPFRSDALSAGMGAWCLLLGAFCLLKTGSGGNIPLQLTTAMITLAVLYGLVHTANLLVFAVLVFLLVLLAWGFYLVSGEQDARTDRSTLALGLGALFLLSSALLIGRTTGGEYDLNAISISTLTVWPLVLLTAFAVAWLGMIPLTGWSALVPSGGYGTGLHSLLLGVPVLTLILRLQSLVTVQAVGATVPASWEAFMLALGWLGGVTGVIAAAGMVVWAGKSRWPALQATFWLGLILWALGFDTPLARYAALVMLFAYGAGRVALELLPRADSSRVVRFLRIFANASLAGMPLTPGFLGVWLLGQSIIEDARPSLALLLVGAVLLAACGTALQNYKEAGSSDELFIEQEQTLPSIRWAGILFGSGLFLVTLLIPFWSPYVEGAAAVAGGTPRLNSFWVGLSLDGGVLPIALLAVGAILLVGLGRLIAGTASSGGGISGSLLPTALDRLGRVAATKKQGSADMSALLENSPAPVWWLSLAWLDRGVYGFGSLLRRLTSRFGGLLGRLEGRYYLPLALILALAALLAVTR